MSGATGLQGRGRYGLGDGYVTLASDQFHPRELALDPTHVYWSNFGFSMTTLETGSIAKVSRAGGAPVVLVDKQRSLGELLVDGGHLYFVADKDLYRIKTDGSESMPTSLMRGTYSLHGIAADAENVYTAVGGDSSVPRPGAGRRGRRDRGCRDLVLATSVTRAATITGGR